MRKVRWLTKAVQKALELCPPRWPTRGIGDRKRPWEWTIFPRSPEEREWVGERDDIVVLQVYANGKRGLRFDVTPWQARAYMLTYWTEFLDNRGWTVVRDERGYYNVGQVCKGSPDRHKTRLDAMASMVVVIVEYEEEFKEKHPAIWKAKERERREKWQR